jgi:ATP-dependent DNA ligase
VPSCFFALAITASVDNHCATRHDDCGSVSRLSQELSGRVYLYLCGVDWAFQRKRPAAIGAKASYPGFIEPALASSIERVPSGARWVHEIKFDGYRVQVHLANETVKVFTRRGHNRTNASRRSLPMHGMSVPGRRSSTVR